MISRHMISRHILRVMEVVGDSGHCDPDCEDRQSELPEYLSCEDNSPGGGETSRAGLMYTRDSGLTRGENVIIEKRGTFPDLDVEDQEESTEETEGGVARHEGHSRFF